MQAADRGGLIPRGRPTCAGEMGTGTAGTRKSAVQPATGAGRGSSHFVVEDHGHRGAKGEPRLCVFQVGAWVHGCRPRVRESVRRGHRPRQRLRLLPSVAGVRHRGIDKAQLAPEQNGTGTAGQATDAPQWRPAGAGLGCLRCGWEAEPVGIRRRGGIPTGGGGSYAGIDNPLNPKASTGGWIGRNGRSETGNGGLKAFGRTGESLLRLPGGPGPTPQEETALALLKTPKRKVRSSSRIGRAAVPGVWCVLRHPGGDGLPPVQKRSSLFRSGVLPAGAGAIQYRRLVCRMSRARGTYMWSSPDRNLNRHPTYLGRYGGPFLMGPGK